MSPHLTRQLVDALDGLGLAPSGKKSCLEMVGDHERPQGSRGRGAPDPDLALVGAPSRRLVQIQEPPTCHDQGGGLVEPPRRAPTRHRTAAPRRSQRCQIAHHAPDGQARLRASLRPTRTRPQRELVAAPPRRAPRLTRALGTKRRPCLRADNGDAAHPPVRH